MTIKNILKNEFFIYSDSSKSIHGFWKTTKNWGSVKINCSVRANSKIQLVIMTQTFSQRIFSGIACFLTVGNVKKFFKNTCSIDQVCNMSFDEVKQAVASCYQQITAAKKAECNVNKLALDFFSIKKTCPAAESQPTPEISTSESLATLSPLQLVVADKLKQSTVLIIRNILMFFMDPKIRAMGPEELKEVLDIARAEFPVQMAKRTEKFFRKIMHMIDLTLDSMQGLPEAFKALVSSSGDPDIRSKLVEGIAFPFINNLLHEFDRENIAIVDQMTEANNQS